MKNASLIIAASLLAFTATAQDLTWAQLVQHPEMWPSQCHLTHGFDFKSGAKVEAGDTVDVLNINRNSVEVATTKGASLAFDVKPDDTDLLDAAQQAFARLTPQQRTLTYAKIFQDQSLWPYELRLKTAFNLSGGIELKKGDPVIFRGVRGGRLQVSVMTVDAGFDAQPRVTAFAVNPQDTDLMEQARAFVEIPGHAPSRMIAELQPLLVSPTTDEPVSLNAGAPPRYIVFVRAANFCPMSQRFLPKLAKFYDEMKQKHPDFEVVYLSCDQSKPDMEAFAKNVGFTWPTVTYKQTSYLYSVVPHFQSLMPQITVMDPQGKVLISGVGESENGVVQATSANGKGNKPVPNAISAAAALDEFGTLLNQSD